MRVQMEAFDAGAELARLHAEHPGVGAVASFLGLVRDVNEGAGVSTLTLEHYPGMTEKALTAILDAAAARWPVLDAVIVHRVGQLRPTEPIVLVAVACAHRHDAFAACAFVMDYLKTRAPFWKKETTPEGERWVEARAADAEAAGRWGVDERGRGRR